MDALIEAVEAGHEGMALIRACPDGTSYEHVGLIVSASTGSLDAALSLHEALLPGRPCSVTLGGEYGASAHYAPTWETLSLTCSAQTPSRAWLLAILRAYRAITPSGCGPIGETE